MTATVGGIVVSYSDRLETALRIASLGVGIIVGVMTFVSLWCKMRRDNRRFKHEENMWKGKK